MFQAIIELSIKYKLWVAIGVVALLTGGLYSIQTIPIDATPDITNNQVQVVTTSPTLAPQEVEQLITIPLESELRNIPGAIEVRSISRFGLSIITVVFKENIPVLRARQLVKEQIDITKNEIPNGIGEPQLMPITTGLGEICQYVIKVKPGFESDYTLEDLRTIQDWIIKKQLNGIEGIIEISSFGGKVKEYEVGIDPIVLQSYGITLEEVYNVLEKNNQNSGSGYIEKQHNLFYIRTNGMLKNLQDIKNIVVAVKEQVPIKISDIAEVTYASAQRFGAMTMDGKGEVVGGITLMLKGENSYKTVRNVKERINQVKTTLPEGLDIYIYLDRSHLIEKTISTVKKNLIEGGIIVIFVVIILLGNIRAGLIVASIIPLSLLFALIMMNIFGVSANLLSLGAIDFGIVVDGAIIIVESVIYVLHTKYLGKNITQKQLDGIVGKTTGEIYKSAAFGILIIILVFIPVMSLTGIEGKMFRPMAMAVSFAILGALLLSLTYVPVMTTLFIKKDIVYKITYADKIMDKLKSVYLPILEKVLKIPYKVVGVVLIIWLFSIFIFKNMGAEFVPTLQEGNIAMQMSIQPGSSLEESIKTTNKIEKIIKNNFPEVIHVISKIGTAEVPTDPMGIEDSDIMIILKEKDKWVSAQTQEELANKIKDKLSSVLGASFEFSQPIQLRFNELMTGAKADIVIKIFGEDAVELKKIADRASQIIKKIEGASDVKVEQTEGLKQMEITYDRNKLAQYGLDVNTLNLIIQSSVAGLKAGTIVEGERRFDLVIRLDEKYRKNLSLEQLHVRTATKNLIPVSEVASVKYETGPMLISREQAQRKINIGINVRGADITSLVQDIQSRLNTAIKLPPGYRIEYGGAFKNLKEASSRLSIAIPIALSIILLLLYITFKSIKDALLIFSAVPLASIGGIIALWIRGLPFSISAGVGFIALFGVAVLNGIVLVSELNYLKNSGKYTSLQEIIKVGGGNRLRPVFMTAMVATLGFFPMALSTSNGAEVQRPLATVVIGGLFTSTLLTLLIVPALYYILENKRFKKKINPKIIISIVIFLGCIYSGKAQTKVSLSNLIDLAYKENIELKNRELQIQKEKLEKKYAYSLNSTSMKVGYGQFNSRESDYQWEIGQDFGNLFSYGKKKNFMDSRVEWLTAKSSLQKHIIIFQLEQLYNQWVYLIEKRKLFTQMDSLYKEGLKKAQFSYEKGETDYMEKQFFKAELEQIIQQKIINEQENINIENNIYNLCGINANEKLEPLERFHQMQNNSISDSINYKYLYEFEKEKERNNKMLAWEKSKRLPELSIGGLMQSIENNYSYYAGVVSVNIPLFNNDYKKLKEQTLLENKNVEYQKEQTKRSINLRIKQLKEQQKLINNELNIFGTSHLEDSKKMIGIADIKYRYGEIDYLQYCSILRSSLESQNTYLDLVNTYNQTLIELNYLTQQN
ncbi:CusA/CzcA family heavy metal efflux RND transporter [uncultured Apibacter sp.]|uniref:CusA/CzcA family heavy metal efflux RND transporter n=1 Tax=uncultured Apibacter sp. TaxID=1778616 RepID=UPI0025FDE26F|nr:CusA/CzcA family heavy metal efflux RND transporter [uncultured Apibacter sp.]